MKISKKQYLLILFSSRHRSTSRLVERIVVAIIFCLISFLLSCEKDQSSISNGKPPPPPPQPKINLTLAEAPYLTEIYLKLEMKNVEFPQAYSITRNGAAILTDSLTSTDTTVIDTGLTPSTAYDYRAYRLVNGQKTDSASLQASTMDTTSHDFTWEVIEIASPFGSGVLRDVAIIGENDIWAVGEIYADSAQPWLPYNAVHWDGQQWELKRIPFTGWCSAVQFPPLRAIFAFSENDIWVARGGSLVHYNGSSFYNDCDMNPLLAGSINKIWGTDSNNLYAVGGTGSIVRYDGSWQKIESGTDLPINDIWGARNQRTGEREILCIASNQFVNQGKKLLHIENTGVTELPDSGLSWALNTVWHVSGRVYFIGGDGLYHSHTIGPTWYRDVSFPPYYKTCVRGNDINDIVVAGAFGLLMHYNGTSWRNYPEIPFMPSGAFARVEVKGNIIVAVGGVDNNGLVLIGIR